MEDCLDDDEEGADELLNVKRDKRRDIDEAFDKLLEQDYHNEQVEILFVWRKNIWSALKSCNSRTGSGEDSPLFNQLHFFSEELQKSSLNLCVPSYKLEIEVGELDGDDERVAGWIEPEVGQLKKMVDFKIARAKEDDDVSDYGFYVLYGISEL